MQNQRLPALLRVEICVARAHRQPGTLAHNRTDLDLDRNIQISYHAADDRHLCSILLSKKGSIRLDDVKQFRDHCRDTAKMSGPGAAIELVTQSLDRNPGHRARGIHLFDTWSEQQVNPRALQQIAV